MTTSKKKGRQTEDPAKRRRPPAELEPLLSTRDLAAYLGVPVATLYGWRYQDVGPQSFRVGRHLRYRLGDVEEWLRSQIAASAHDQL